MIGVGRWNSVRLGHTVQTEGQEDRDDSMAPWAGEGDEWFIVAVWNRGGVDPVKTRGTGET